MKKIISLILMVLLISSVVSAEPWKTRDKALLAGYVVLNAIDAYQTSQINGRDEIEEMNPMFTDADGNVTMERVVGYKLLAVAGVYLLSDFMPKYRTGILSVACGIQGAVVAWNLQF